MEISVDFPGGAQVDAHFGTFTVSTAQPQKYGGKNSAPAPFELFLAALATCAGYYVLEFCKARGIPTDGIRLLQRSERDEATKMVAKITLDIHLPAGFPQKYIPALVRAAESCAVKKHLENPPVFEVKACLD